MMDLRGGRRLSLRAFASLLATHVFLMPLPVSAQQAGPRPEVATPAIPRPTRGAIESMADSAATGAGVVEGTVPVDPTATATVPPVAPQQLEMTDDLNGALTLDEDLGRQNLRETRLDDPTADRIRRDEEEDTGLRLGTLTLRPSISQRIGSESTTDNGIKEHRIFSETGLKGTLTSDWSRHELTIGGEGIWQETLSGGGSEKPRASLDANLRLDLADDTIANISGAYRFSREDTDDPNAVSGASVQSGVNQFDAGVSLERDFGLLRGSIAGDLTRFQYSDAELSDGTTIERGDRNRLRSTLSARLGYELSPALTPFVEGTIGRIAYDDSVDTTGYRRSADLYGVKTGLALDLGDKLKGELALGHEQQRFEDARLADLSALTIDGNLAWSPQEGTILDLTLDTSIDPSTTAGVNGAVVHAMTAALAHDLRSNLVARLTAGTTLTRFDDDAAINDTTRYLAGAGVTWKVNHYLDATADLNYERTNNASGPTDDSLTALVGLTAKR